MSPRISAVAVERRPRRRAGRERHAQHLLAPQREDALGRAVTGDVDDDQRDLAAAGREEVVAVAGDHAFGRAQPTGHRPAVGHVADHRFELGAEREHHRRALLDRLPRPLRLHELLADVRARIASTSRASDASSGGPGIWIGESSAPPRTRRTSSASWSIGRVTQRRMSHPADHGTDDRHDHDGGEQLREPRPDVVEVLLRARAASALDPSRRASPGRPARRRTAPCRVPSATSAAAPRGVAGACRRSRDRPPAAATRSSPSVDPLELRPERGRVQRGPELAAPAGGPRRGRPVRLQERGSPSLST